MRVLIRFLSLGLAAVAWAAGLPSRAALADATSSPGGSPGPGSTTPATGLGSTGHGTGFIVLAIILVAALVFSGWRLRRDR